MSWFVATIGVFVLSQVTGGVATQGATNTSAFSRTESARGDQIWAYTQYPQRAGEHYVVTQQGVEQMSPEDLRKRLEQQRAPIKLSR